MIIEWQIGKFDHQKAYVDGMDVLFGGLVALPIEVERLALEQKIYQLLTGETTITNVSNTRIFVSTMPDNIRYPSISFKRVAGEPMNVMTEIPLMERVQVQIISYSSELETAYNLSTSIHEVMNGSTTFKAILTSRQDISDQQRDMKRLYKISSDFSCLHKTT